MADILIVDDEPQIRNLLTQYLEGAGHGCLSAENVTAAKELLKAYVFDLILSDITMPGQSGIDLIRYASANYADTPMIMVSNIDNPEDVKVALELGVYGYIVKPFTRNIVLINIENALQRKQLERDKTAHLDQLETLVRRRTQALDSQVSFLQTLIDAIPSPIYYKDRRGVYLGCNTAFEAFIGKKRGTIVGQTVFDVAPGKSAAVYHQADLHLITKGGTQIYDTAVQPADGSVREVVFHKAAFTDGNGDVAGLVGVILDITERKQAEKALFTNERKYRRIFENSVVGFFQSTPQGRFISVNPALAKMLGYSSPQETVSSISDIATQYFVNPQDRVRYKQILNDHGYVEGFEHEAQRKDGSRLWVSDSTRAYFEDQDQTVHYEGVVIDISHRKRVDAERDKLQSQLIQAQKMESIGQLAAGVAHEINNPTGFVSSNLKSLQEYQQRMRRLIGDYQQLKAALQVLPQGQLPPNVTALIATTGATEKEIDIQYILNDVDGLIGDCRQGTDRIEKIVADLKYFSHPGENKMKQTDINAGIESCLNVVHNELKYKATIVKQLGKVPLIRAYPQQLNQVFMNILVNAAQAIEQCGEIRIATTVVDGEAVIQISDTGCGIPAENLGKVFDPFFTTKAVGTGTGLGMNIAYNIINKHNGTIRVTSTVGQGTMFCIRLPLGIWPEVAAPAAEPQRVAV